MAEKTASEREAWAQRVRDYRARNPEQVRKGLEKDKSRHAAKQELKAGRPRPATCDACGGPPDMNKSLCYDHCHKRGHFRGWLCHRCNVILGMARDDPDVLSELIDYLVIDAILQRRHRRR